eukprot:2930909-Amphidinium_carterae.3
MDKDCKRDKSPKTLRHGPWCFRLCVEDALQDCSEIPLPKVSSTGCPTKESRILPLRTKPCYSVGAT